METSPSTTLHQSIQKRPKILLAWAQSIDGSVCLNRGTAFPISCKESMIYTHRLRSRHSAILIGSSTFLNDNPRLNTRLIDSDTNNPQPIILDSFLSSWRKPDLKLFTLKECVRPIILTLVDKKTCPEKYSVLEKCTKALIVCKKQKYIDPFSSTVSFRVDLVDAMEKLYRLFKFDSIMVEGGPSVVTSFFQHQLVDSVSITTSPILLGGYSSIQKKMPLFQIPKLINVERKIFGNDLILEGRVEFCDLTLEKKKTE